MYGDPPKQEKQTTDGPQPYTMGESNYITANHKYFAYAVKGGGGPMYVAKLDNHIRVTGGRGIVSTQGGKVTDLKFNPFYEDLLASCSEDGSVHINKIEVEKDNSVKVKKGAEHAIQTIKEAKRLLLIDWHPTSSHVLATAGFGKTVRTWDMETGQEKFLLETKHSITSMQWSQSGKMLLVGTKGQELVLYDPRQGLDSKGAVVIKKAFTGSKSVKAWNMERFNYIGSTGYTKSAKCQLKIWDFRNSEEVLEDVRTFESTGQMMPYWDDHSELLFLYSKGGSTVHYASINPKQSEIYYPLGTERFGDSQKGGCFIPKRACDVMKCEVARYMKLTSRNNKGVVVPTPLIVPRRIKTYPEDLYNTMENGCNGCPAGESSQTASEYFSGQDAAPRLLHDLNPANKVEKKKVVYKSPAEWEKEVDGLKTYILELESKLGIAAEDSFLFEPAVEEKEPEKAEA